MDWISKLERKYRKYAITGIMKYLIILQIVGYAMIMVNPSFYFQYLKTSCKNNIKKSSYSNGTYLNKRNIPKNKKKIIYTEGTQVHKHIHAHTTNLYSVGQLVPY